MLTLLLAAFLIVKKFFIVNTVIIGLLTANDIYIMLYENFFFRFREIPEILEESLPYYCMDTYIYNFHRRHSQIRL